MSGYREQRGQYGYPNPCPVCEARPFMRCVVPRTGRKTDTHVRRVRGEWPTPSLDQHPTDTGAAT